MVNLSSLTTGKNPKVGFEKVINIFYEHPTSIIKAGQSTQSYEATGSD
jgi:hypothetical protein